MHILYSRNIQQRHCHQGDGQAVRFVFFETPRVLYQVQVPMVVLDADDLHAKEVSTRV